MIVRGIRSLSLDFKNIMAEEQTCKQLDEHIESQQAEHIADVDTANYKHQVENDDDRKMFVGGLSWETTENDLKEYMSQFGTVFSCNVKKDMETNRSRGFGFIVFEDSLAVQKVLAKSEHKLQGKTIDPKRANPKGKFQEPASKKIYVGKVSQSTTEEQIKEYFSQWGKIEKVVTPFDKEKEQRRNFVFVEFETEEGANKALNHTTENPEYKFKIGSDEVEIRKATPGARGRGRGGFFHGSDQGGRGGTSTAAYGGYGGWSGGYSNQGYTGNGAYGSTGYGTYGSGGYGGYGYGNYGGYTYDPTTYSYSGWSGYNPSSYYVYNGQEMGDYGKAPKSIPGAVGSTYHPY